MKKTNRILLTLSQEEQEKIVSLMRTLKEKKATTVIKKIISEYTPPCEECREIAKRTVINKKVFYLCEDCKDFKLKASTL